MDDNLHILRSSSDVKHPPRYLALWCAEDENDDSVRDQAIAYLNFQSVSGNVSLQ